MLVKEEYGLKICIAILPSPFLSPYTCKDEMSPNVPAAPCKLWSFCMCLCASPALQMRRQWSEVLPSLTFCPLSGFCGEKKYLGILWKVHPFALKPFSISTSLLVWIPQRDWNPQRGFINVLLIKYYAKQKRKHVEVENCPPCFADSNVSWLNI